MQPLFRNIYKECDGLRELLRFEKKEIKMSKENAQNFMKMIGEGGELSLETLKNTAGGWWFGHK